MKTWETFTMSRKEVPRAGLLKVALAGKITNVDGALALHLSVRQCHRVKVRFAAEGAALRVSVERPSHAYAASKGAVLGLTRAMAAPYGRDRIRVNAICPGTFRTRLTADIVERVERKTTEGGGIPVGRVGEPEGIARCALFLASDDVSFISGIHIVVGGGAMAATA